MDPHQIESDRARAADLLRAYFIQSHRVLDRMMTAEGASFARARMLMLIAREEPVRSIDLAAQLGISPRTVTEAIDALERVGAVRRDPDPDDRRAKRITIMPDGRNAIEGAEAARRRFVAQAFDGLTDEEIAALAALLAKLVERVAAIGA